MKEPYNRFICTINKSFPRVKRERGRMEKKKRPLNQWSMRWLYLTSKPSRVVQAKFWLSFLLFQWLKWSTWCASVLAGSLPLLLQTKTSKQCYFLSVWRNMSMAIFPHFPLFSFLFGIHLYWSPCFVPSAQRSSSKRSWDSFPRFLLWRGACWEYLWLLISEVV